MIATTSTTLIGALAPVASWPRALRLAMLMVAGSLFVALSAQAQIPLWPVPITGQTLAVLLIGMAYGARLGAATMLLYAAEGAVGLPVFAKFAAGPGVILGPTGGYILGFVVAAFLVGWLAERGWSRTPVRTAAAMILGNLAIWLPGVLWLANYFGGLDPAVVAKMGAETALGAALTKGLYPFLLGDAIKVVLAACLFPLAWRGVARLKR
jgi:biotin transport system substrate-specific component